MKKLFAVLFMISGLQIAKAEEASVPVEQKVVELRITRRPIGMTDTRFKKITQDMGTGVCSGSFIDGRGDILTAGHCAANAESIEVLTYDGRRYNAVIVATTSLHDLALLHIDRLNTAHFTIAKTVTRGEKIFILGSSLALTSTLSTGVIAKLDGDWTLLDCGVLPGNSGSAVYNEAGEMVGVATAGFVVGMGMTHLNIAQGADAVLFFLFRAFSHLPQ